MEKENRLCARWFRLMLGNATDTDLSLRPTIAVVEDNDQIASLLVRVLKREGYDVTRFRDAETALEQLPTLRPSLVILDRGLPGMDGFALLERMRGLPSLANLPVLMLTGYSDESDIVKGFALGANDYLVKPFHPAELLARLRRLLRR